ncbi:hypothetical protein B0H16DRAFT_1452492 [Mycena metata]|uniref:Uncharacterized protein n=1 Tax=Mycena metata TaxID=1033252 RepID=A0AAD7JPK1_9AGAR|nr:hypothetical protein B0H16DRAFT_1452492 [Mycena metata]
MQSSLFGISAKKVALAGIELVTQTYRTMIWAKKAVTDLLHSHGTRYFESKGDDCDTVLTSIVDILRAAQINDLPDGLPAKVKVWYNNNISLFRKDAVTKEVAREVHDERYEAIKTEIREAGTEWHEVYRQAIARLWQELNGELQEEEKCKLVLRAAIRLARANANKEVAAFLKKMHNVYGVRMLCLSSLTDPDEKAQTSVPKFSQQFPKWKTMEGVLNAFLEYSEFFADPDTGEENSDGEDQASKANKSKYPWAIVGSIPNDELPNNLQEYPLFPEVPKETAQEYPGKIVIRAFVKEELKLALQCRRGVQWQHLMVLSEVEAIYNLWIGRQKEKKILLRFKVAEAKRKIEADQRVRIQSLKRKQPAYVLYPCT